MYDLSERISCSDGSCTGVINDKSDLSLKLILKKIHQTGNLVDFRRKRVRCSLF